MKIAITGGTGFVGRYLARELVKSEHKVVLIARGVDQRDESIRHSVGVSFAPIGTDDEVKLAEAFCKRSTDGSIPIAIAWTAAVGSGQNKNNI